MGTLSVVCGSPDAATRVLSQLKLIIRPMYSSPPCHGSGIVKTILADEDLSAQYYKECASMAARITEMRSLLRTELETVGSTLNWSHITNQIGMFAFTGMSKDQVENLISRHHVFMTKDGRISLAGINSDNAKYVAAAIHDVTRGA